MNLSRLLCLLLALTLFLPVHATAENYVSNFTSGFDGWYARSAGLARIELADGALRISRRSMDWHSPGRDFLFSPGSTAQLSVEVMQDSQDVAEFILSVAHSNAGGRETYENIARTRAKRGEWVKIEGTYIAGDFSKFTLYVETMGAPNLDFSIRAFSVAGAGKSYDMELPKLKTLYGGYFDFGCAVTRREVLDADRMAFYASQFNIMTHGNELKPENVLDLAACREMAKSDPAAVAVKIDSARPLLDFCRDNGIKVHGHVLLWHQQTPEAFFREGYVQSGPFVTREIMLARMENYIRLVLETTESEYPGLIVSWDVVNEAVDDGTGMLRTNNWTKVAGADFVHRAFKYARKYARPDMMLYYNDYSTPYEPKLTGILKLLSELLPQGNIDGYGFQCHYHWNTPGVAQVENAIVKVTALGLRLRVSELDILIDSNTQENLDVQARRYGEFLALFRKYKDHIDAVHTWGVTDDLSWRAGHFPLLFDKNALPKPAFYSVVEPMLKP